MNAHTLDGSSPTGSIHHAAVKKCRSMPEYSALETKLLIVFLPLNWSLLASFSQEIQRGSPSDSA